MRAGSADYRLVFRRRWAYLYDVDASPYTGPVWWFGVGADQELPRLVAGARVSIGDPVARGSRPTIDVDGTVVRARSSARSGRRTPWLAERPCVVHPQAVGWEESWQWAVLSTWSIDEWRDRVRWAGRSRPRVLIPLAAWFAALAWYLQAIIVGIVSPAYLALVPLIGLFIVSRFRDVSKIRGARRTLGSLRQAEDALLSPPRTMWMSLRWTVGYGDGALAVAELFDSAEACSPVATLAVCNLAPRLRIDARVEVEVFGDPSDTPVIRFGSSTLWPLDHRYVPSDLKPEHDRRLARLVTASSEQ